jgi:hypothetical protein
MWKLLCLLLFLIFVPLLSIWSVNVLFSTDIPYSITTWIASMWLTVLILNRSNREKQV